ncbi:nicotinamide riboside transporter PnuC [Actinocorallia aurantiaca]|uniref:Nicotinamide riboside transporter PnuC n=1 Tax=Actinocorallia aurantiaca TaxID=46204 RepID=A0ABP6GU51_9ACTN
MLHDLVGPLLEPAFTLGETPTSWGEVLGFVTGVLTVWLVVRQHIANWGVGIVNVVILGLIFLDGGLYADASLQIVYVVLGLYGWWAWLYGGENRTERLVQRTSRGEWAGVAVGIVAATGVMTWVLVSFTESTVPFWDALTTALSLAATYGQCRKLVESWVLWITVDLIYVPLYAYKGLYLTGALYVIFLGLCVAGLRAWWRDLAGRAGVPVAA